MKVTFVATSMEQVEKSIVVNAPVAVVYEWWTRFEDYPKFMPALSEVRRLSERRLLWKGERSGIQFESVADVTLQIPERRIAWRNLSGPENSGVVCLEGQLDGRTEVSFRMKYVPDAGWQEPRALEERIERSLENFKTLVEEPAGDLVTSRQTVMSR